jgi:uncharacterized repeat protein (TIGR02543 family)
LINTEGSLGWEDKWAGLPVSHASGTWYYLLDFDDATLRGCVRPCSPQLVIPSSVNGHEVTAIGDEAFAGNNLEGVTFPSTVNEIRYRAFWSNQLKMLTIPSSVTQIKDQAFMWNQLNSVEFLGDAPSGDYDVFKYNPLTKISVFPLTEGWDDTWSGIPVSSSRLLTFNSLGGTTVSDYEFDPGDSIPKGLSSPTRSGYKFLGWSVTNGGRVITFPYTPEVTSDITFYALWSKNPVKAQASTKPIVSGIPSVNKTLVANKGAWSGYPTPTFSYQWYACSGSVSKPIATIPTICKKITGATKSTLKLGSAQKGKFISVMVTGTSTGTTKTTWVSKSTAKVK